MIYNGVDFSQWMRCGATKRVLPPVDNVTTENASGVGASFLRRKLQPLVIPVFCRLTLGREKPKEEVATIRRRMAAALLPGSPAMLVLDDEPERSYMAVVSSCDDLSSLGPSGSFRVEFTAHDPIAYGNDLSADVSPAMSVMVDGTYETRPVFRLKSTSGGSSRVKVANQDTGAFVQLDAAANQGASVIIDMEDETVTVNGNPCPVTLSSDFFALDPGLNHIQVTGATGTVEWTERWL